jgi:hypothetical protein
MRLSLLSGKVMQNQILIPSYVEFQCKIFVTYICYTLCITEAENIVIVLWVKSRRVKCQECVRKAITIL